MLLYKKKGLASALGISERKVDDLDAKRLLPRKVRIGRSVRWRISDIETWLELDCPNRERFELEKERRCTNERVA